MKLALIFVVGISFCRDWSCSEEYEPKLFPYRAKPLEEILSDEDLMDKRPFLSPQTRGLQSWPNKNDPNQYSNYSLGVFQYKHLLHYNLFASYRFPTCIHVSGDEAMFRLMQKGLSGTSQFYRLPTGLDRFYPGLWSFRGQLTSLGDDQWFTGDWVEPAYPSVDPWMTFEGFDFVLGNKGKRTWARDLVWFRNYYAFVGFINARAFTKAEYTEKCYTLPDSKFRYTPMTVVSKMVPMGEPYEVSCLTCSLRTGKDGEVTVFLRYSDRDPFTSHRPDNVQRISEALFQDYTQTFYDTLYRGDEEKPEGGKKEMLMEWETGWPFVAERWREEGMTDSFYHKTPMREPDGRLIIEPNPTMTNKFDTAWVGQSIVCHQTKDGRFKLENFDPSYYNVLVNVDSLSRVVDIKQQTPKTWKLKDLKPPGDEEIKRDSSSQLNLKIETTWSEWSCCTGCCCKKLQNRAECHFPPSDWYDTDSRFPEIRNSVSVQLFSEKFVSNRTRKGYCAIKKIDESENLKYGLDGTVPEKQWRILNAWLSSGDYIRQGIPCFSTLLLRMERHPATALLVLLQTLRMADSYFFLEPGLKDLMDHILKTYFGSSELKTRRDASDSIGFYTEVGGCPEEQRTDCRKWLRCRNYQATGALNVDADTEAVPIPPQKVTPCGDCDSVVYDKVVTFELQDWFAGKNMTQKPPQNIQNGTNMKIIIDTKGTNARRTKETYIEWEVEKKSGGPQDVDVRNEGVDVAQQKVFLTPDTLTFFALKNTEDFTVRITPNFRTENYSTVSIPIKIERTQSSASEMIRTYIIIGGTAGGVVVLGVAGCSVFRIWKQKKDREKKRMKKKLYKIKQQKRRQKKERRLLAQTMDGSRDSALDVTVRDGYQ